MGCLHSVTGTRGWAPGGEVIHAGCLPLSIEVLGGSGWAAGACVHGPGVGVRVESPGVSACVACLQTRVFANGLPILIGGWLGEALG
jgi:hypothetical protein